MERKYVNPSFPHLLHGADYNPEQWSDTPEVWDEDMRLMQAANANEMSVGIFSWAVLEPREGEYDFSFLDTILDKVYAAGGRVILATPSGARPHWMADKYPEVLRVTPTRDRMSFSTRHNHCMTSPVYREKVREMNTRLAARYGNHPAVIAWHLSNEYGGECYCPCAAPPSAISCASATITISRPSTAPGGPPSGATAMTALSRSSLRRP